MIKEPTYTSDRNVADSLVALDIFCGAGGMSLGFEKEGFVVSGACDIETRNTDIFATNFPMTKTITADVSDTSARDLANAFGTGSEQIDVIFGGPPCQGFSVGGQRQKDDPRNGLIADFARIVVELQPRSFVMENVGGLLSGGKDALAGFVSAVESAGYQLPPQLPLLDASDFGVPQRRKRLFVVGLHESVRQRYAYPTPGSIPTPTVWDAIADLPAIEKCEDLSQTDRYTGSLASPTSDYARLMREPSPHDPAYMGLGGCARTKHGVTTLRRFSETLPGHREPISRFMKLDPDGIAPTLRAGSDSRHGSFTAPRPIHPKSPRCITVREAARLHSIPDWFELHPTKWHGFSQVGNAVPPRLSRAIASTIRKVLLPETCS